MNLRTIQPWHNLGTNYSSVIHKRVLSFISFPLYSASPPKVQNLLPPSLLHFQPPLNLTISLFAFEFPTVMEEQFVLRVPPSVAERLDRLLSENASSDDKSLDLSFEEDGRSGTFVIGNDRFPASLLDLPTVVESYKTYDDSVLIKTADIGQMIMVRDPNDPAPDTVEYRHGLTPPMRDARKRRFRREPDLNPELVQRVEQDLLNISAGGPADNVDIEVAEQEKNRDGKAGNTSKNPAPAPESKTDIPEAATNTGEPDGEPDRSDSDESDDSI